MHRNEVPTVEKMRCLKLREVTRRGDPGTKVDFDAVVNRNSRNVYIGICIRYKLGGEKRQTEKSLFPVRTSSQHFLNLAALWLETHPLSAEKEQKTQLHLPELV